jgi:acyl carrier protein
MEGIEVKVREWLVDWFCAHSSVGRDVVETNLESNYLERGWIDSMQFITLISAIEDEFSVEFSNDEFQDRTFATINGLSQIIAQKASRDK